MYTWLACLLRMFIGRKTVYIIAFGTLGDSKWSLYRLCYPIILLLKAFLRDKAFFREFYHFCKAFSRESCFLQLVGTGLSIDASWPVLLTLLFLYRFLSRVSAS